MLKMNEVSVNLSYNGEVWSITVDSYKDLHFVGGIGWIHKDELSRPDVIKFLYTRHFMSQPENIYHCDRCPINAGVNSKCPCGHQQCEVELVCEGGEANE